ncbi:DUF7344 domain-containing protein [Haloarcula rubra]|nr:hypothetical protein [Halomicroarcula rubra]
MSDLQEPISTETALRLLLKQQRRQILRRVAETSDGTTVDQLKKHLGGEGPMNSDANGSVENRGIELHHVHLPMLQEANVIDYDADQSIVCRGQEFQNILSLLEVIDGHREDTSTELS